VGLALGQDGPVRVSAVDLDALSRRDSERSGVQLLAQLPAEHIEHDPLSVALLARAARRQLVARPDGSGFRRHGGLGNASTGDWRGAIYLPVMVPEPNGTRRGRRAQIIC
jgi:hypothetical protein